CLDPRADPAVRCKGSDHGVEIETSPAVVTIGGETRVFVGTDVHNSGKVGRAGVVSLRLTGDPVALEPRSKFDPEAGMAYRGPDLLTHGSGTGDGCGGVWSSPAVDPTSGMVFFGTSSCDADRGTGWESMWGITVEGNPVWSFRPPRPSSRLDDD